jgi:hypothetical protein
MLQVLSPMSQVNVGREKNIYPWLQDRSNLFANGSGKGWAWNLENILKGLNV